VKRNVLATELHLPIVLGAIIGIPILEVWLSLGWSREALGVVEIGVMLFVFFIGKPVQAWLAPRIGIPPPRQMGSKRKA
jgi:Na+/phosphate symporter